MSATYRVSVSLERYFSDERSRARLVVDGRWSRVAGLAAHVRAVFALRGAFCLVSAGHLLPPAEPLAPLLRDGDTLSVIPIEESWRNLTDEDEAADAAELDDRVDVVRGDIDRGEPPPDHKILDRVGKKKKKKKNKPEPAEPASPTSPPEPPALPDTPERRTASAEPEPRPEGGAADDDALQSVKMRALALLGEVAARAAAARGGRVTKRRRVRRRHARVSEPLPAPPTPPRLPTAPSANSHTRFAESPPPPAVLQNASTSPRAGRVVRALSPSGASPPPGGEPPPAEWPASLLGARDAG